MDERKVKGLCSLIERIIPRGLTIASRDKFYQFAEPLGTINHTILVYLEGPDPPRNKAMESALQLMLLQFNMLMATLDSPNVQYINSIDSKASALVLEDFWVKLRLGLFDETCQFRGGSYVQEN